ncbi:riboflavin synthase [Proteiniclasticum sp. QWL-01]|uniref:riboflavin synthase n=1 Tax=Proteiniclasticum sp. QWL-01 TaxID=3036945 RepID=UPI00240FCCAD|nr:riboflavin synthase [Proteiniclasticum sp. QWL-01]WFF72383.1 riboflavin synthase [Proteiniclasticum sp. QWL-01]
MFTGIIEEVGALRTITRTARSIQVTIAAARVLEGLQPGDSIATNGVCLTVTRFDARGFTCDVMPQTMTATTLGDLTPGDPVNLERALTLSQRLGGHLVSGHIDGTGRITKLERDDIAVRITVSAPLHLMRYFTPKGSVALDGISLTLSAANQDSIEVSVIPHTWQHTALANKQVGSAVNLECDLIAKYVERLLSGPGSTAAGSGPEPEPVQSGELNTGFLAAHGFL